MKTRQNNMGVGELHIKNEVLNYLTPFIYIDIEVPNGRNH